MELIIVRHAITGMNKDGRVNGSIDEPLSAEGLQQAQKLALELHADRIDAIYSSPLQAGNPDDYAIGYKA